MEYLLKTIASSTTFLSVIFAIVNSLRLQRELVIPSSRSNHDLSSTDFVARGISDYLTSETGITIIFESAIVPKWKDSRISFKNVYVSRRPMTTPRQKLINAHMAAAGIGIQEYQDFGEYEEDEAHVVSEQDTNYSMFDLNIDSVDVTLSLWRWLDGRGLVEDAVVKGVRGVLGAVSEYYLSTCRILIRFW